jgi:hypothetical protein
MPPLPPWPALFAQGAVEEQEFQQGVDDARGRKKIRVRAF